MAFLSSNRRRLTEGDLRLMGMPPRYWPDQGDGSGVLLNFASDGRHKKAAHNYMSKMPEMLDKGYGIYFYGDSGTGKTCLAALIAHEARRYDAVVSFFTAYELREATAQRRQWDENISVMDRAKNVDLLIIDDLGKELGSYGMREDHFFEHLIKVRNDHLRSTIITSNIAIDDIARQYSSVFRNSMQGSIYAIKVEGKNFYEGRDSALGRAIGFE